MRNETKIFADTAPVVLWTLIDCTTYGELINYLEKRNIKWEFAKQSMSLTPNFGPVKWQREKNV